MHHKKFVFAAACLGMALFGVVFLSLGSIINMLSDRFLLGDAGVGTLTAILPAGILAGSLIFGPVVDRFGYKWLMVVCSLMVLAALEGIAFSRSLGAVQGFIFLIGFGGGVLNGATNALAADVSEGERGAKLGLLGVFFGLGALGMPASLATLSKHFPTHDIIAGIGLLVLLPVSYFLAIRYPPPKQSAHAPRGALLGLLREPLLWFMGMVLAFQSGMEGMTNDWTPRVFVLVHQVSQEKAMLALMAYVAALVVARLCLGEMLKLVSARALLFISYGLVAAGALLLIPQAGFVVALAGCVLLGFGLAACFPVMLGLVGDLYPTRSGSAFSIIFVIALLGNMAANKTMGWVGSRWGTGQFPLVLLACVGCASLLLFVVLRKLNQKHPQILKTP